MLAFARPALAHSLVAALQGESVFGDEHNGLFLAAPRRTGKSTFLQHDLAPALQAQGITVVYVDLWADPRRDPGSLIAEAIGSALQQHLGIVARTARKAGLDKVKVAGLEVDTSKIGQTSGLTLAQALGMLIDHAGQPPPLLDAAPPRPHLSLSLKGCGMDKKTSFNVWYFMIALAALLFLQSLVLGTSWPIFINQCIDRESDGKHIATQ